MGELEQWAVIDKALKEKNEELSVLRKKLSHFYFFSIDEKDPPTKTPLLIGWAKACIVDDKGDFEYRPYIYPEFVFFNGTDWVSWYDTEDVKHWSPDYWMYAPSPPQVGYNINSEKETSFYYG